MKFEVKIVATNLEDNVLYITARIPRREYASQTRIKIFDKDIIEMIDNKFKIIKVIHSKVISNSISGNHSQQATWVFEVSEKTEKLKLSQKTVKNTQPIEPEIEIQEPEVQVIEPETAPPRTKKPVNSRRKSSTSGSIRGRMSKIAKDKKQTT
jgi:hypothetical protein